MSDLLVKERCFHCEQTIEKDALTATFGDEVHHFCGDSCVNAAARIHGLDLGDFYRYRDRFGGGSVSTAATGPAVARAGTRSREERLLEFSSSVVMDKSGKRLSIRVPDIRCAACTWLIENSLSGRADVLAVRTNLADKVVTVNFVGDDPLALVMFVESLGFTVLPDRANEAKQALAAERKSMLARLGLAGIGMMQVMMYAIATYVAGEGGIEPAYESLMRYASLAVTTPIVFYSAMPFHRGAIRDLRNRTVGMDVPVSAAILAAYTLSMINTLAQSGEVYFDSAAMFTFLLLIGRFVELGSRQRYQQSQMINENLLPASAVVAGTGDRIALNRIAPGMVLAVAPGESIPADGVIVSGKTSVIEAAFTGEGRPLEKVPGERVLAGSDNLEGGISVRATASFDDFVITRISRLYRESSSYKPAFSVLADVIARYFVVGVLLTSCLTGLYWYMAGSALWFSIALAVLVVSCPCALSLATPVAYTVSVATMRSHGVIISQGAFLEKLANITHIVFDKTGTLTRGLLRVERVVTLPGVAMEHAFSIASALEESSKHPVALAFQRPTDKTAEKIGIFPGEGVEGTIDGSVYRLGKPLFACPDKASPPDEDGNWVLLASAEPLAWFLLSDELREESPAVIHRLSKHYGVSLFTGDASADGKRIAESTGVTDIHTGMTPEDKLMTLRAMQAGGERVLMVGDGINDAAAMAVSHASIAVSPVDIVVQEAADATLVRADLALLPMALRYSRRVRRIIRQNIGWAVCYNLCVIPLAMTGVILPWMAALGMSLSSMLVVLNANRLMRLR